MPNFLRQFSNQDSTVGLDIDFYLDNFNTNGQVRIAQVNSVSLSSIHYDGCQRCNCIISVDATVVPGFVHYTKLQSNKK